MITASNGARRYSPGVQSICQEIDYVTWLLHSYQIAMKPFFKPGIVLLKRKFPLSH